MNTAYRDTPPSCAGCAARRDDERRLLPFANTRPCPHCGYALTRPTQATGISVGHYDTRTRSNTVWWVPACRGNASLIIAKGTIPPWWKFWARPIPDTLFRCPLSAHAPAHFHVQCGQCRERLTMHTMAAETPPIHTSPDPSAVSL